jgi:GNAT superfamily N-acetyltransferase
MQSRPGDLNLAFDEVIQLAGGDIGLVGIDRGSDCWFLDKLYLLPAYQNRGIGSYLLQSLIDERKGGSSCVAPCSPGSESRTSLR